MQTHFRFIFNLHAGKDSTTELLKPLCDVQNYSKLSRPAQVYDKCINHNSLSSY